jgi:predicted Rossmann fold flavoprotein
MSSAINKIAIVGGGASGFFCALRCADLIRQQNLNASVHIFEASPGFLKKVRISGGGRCNVTHNIFESRKFTENYPRGAKELRSPFQTFQALDTLKWFKERGVDIVAENDGRMFPTTNSSETIINCFLNEAEKLNVELNLKHNIQKIEKNDNGKFKLEIRDHDDFICDSLVLATGSSPTGYRFAKNLGHTITDLAPSLFSFKISDPFLTDLPGTSFPDAKIIIKIPAVKSFKQMGPILITHWGLSGPAVLKASAWAARELKDSDYKSELVVNWLGLENLEVAKNLILSLKEENTKMSVKNTPPKGLTKKFWEKLLIRLNIKTDKRWADLSKKDTHVLAEALFCYNFKTEGKNRYKDEFVECGGVALKEVDFKTAGSKQVENLYITGELLDVDGITGGFNFQNAWTTGWLAAGSIVSKL